MQKKLIVLAVSGALGVPLAAFAQQSGITIYGRANLGSDRYTATGATNTTGNLTGRMRVFDSGSRLGIRGSENLGGGMEAYFVLENGVNWDNGSTGGQSGVANASAGLFASRDSFVGLRAGWGEVSWGRQSIFWTNGLNAQSGANYINASADGMLTSLGMITPPATRQSNVIYYTSPRMAGFDVAAAYSPNTQEPSSFTGTNQTKGYVWGLNLKYRLGGWYVQADHAVNKNKGNDPTGPTDTGDKLGFSYGYAPGSRVGFIFQRLKNAKIVAATVTKYADAGIASTVGDSPKETMFGVNWEHMVGQTQLLAGYFRGGEVKGFSGTTTGTKSTAFHIGAKQHLSKRTGVYVSYNAIKNDPHAFADFVGGGYSSAQSSLSGAAGLDPKSAGADPKAIAVGLMHNF